MEEAQGEIFLWHELRENFIKDFSFIPQNEKLVKTAKQIKAFIELTENNNLTQNHDRPTITYNNIQSKVMHSQQDYKWKMKIRKGKFFDGNHTMHKQQNQFAQYLKSKKPTKKIPTK